MRVVADLLTREEAYGDDWVVPGSGPVSAIQLAGILTKLLNREEEDAKVRAFNQGGGSWMSS
jgi:hypothetical protein